MSTQFTPRNKDSEKDRFNNCLYFIGDHHGGVGNAVNVEMNPENMQIKFEFSSH